MLSESLSQEFSLDGKVAIVTGAGRGIGKAVALTLAEAGADVIVVARTVAQIEDTAKEIREMGRKSLVCPADVSNEAQVEEMVKKTISQFGRIDILVNDAAIALTKTVIPLPLDVKGAQSAMAQGLGETLSLEDWQSVLAINLTGTFLCCRAVAPHMMKQEKGKIINFSSAAADEADVGWSVYNTSKAAVSHLTRCLAVEWGPYINVNAIGPGFLPTDQTAGLRSDPEAWKAFIDAIPVKRMGECREIALLVLYLAAKASDYLTGQVIYLDGGELAAR